MYKSIKYFTIGGAVVVTTIMAIAMKAVAVNSPERYQNVGTQKCLDSNSAGEVYTFDCNGGSFQKWNVSRVTPYRILKNAATGKCLESNTAGQAYTLNCNGGSFQKWNIIGVGSYIKFKNVATGKCLESNTAGQTYTLDCNDGNFQNWQ
jgi:serine/threonine-protein kinase